jgi:hypothetical protein
MPDCDEKISKAMLLESLGRIEAWISDIRVILEHHLPNDAAIAVGGGQEGAARITHAAYLDGPQLKAGVCPPPQREPDPCEDEEDNNDGAGG